MIHPTVQIAPLCIIDDGVEIGEGTKVWHFTHICRGARIGKNCVISQGCYVGPNVVIRNGCRIQNGVSIFEGVTLEDSVFVGPNATFTNDRYPPSEKGTAWLRMTHVCKGAVIGANATIVCPCIIGTGAFVGAGAVVTKDVRDGETVVGNPARPMKLLRVAGMLEKTEITPREAAQRLGQRLDSVYALVWTGRLPARKQDGRWLIPASAVESRLKAKGQKRKCNVDI